MILDDLQLTHFFTTGLGFDLAGALLVAVGLVADPGQLNRTSGAFWGSNAYQAVSAARDRIDAVTGLTALALGFVLQGVGYLALLSGRDSTHTGRGEVVAGALAMGLAFLLVLGAALVHRRLRHVPLVIEMSRRNLDGSRLPYPSASSLPDRLKALGYVQHEGEDDLTFVQRTTGVEDMVVQVPSLPGTTEQRSRLASEPPLEGERT